MGGAGVGGGVRQGWGFGAPATQAIPWGLGLHNCSPGWVRACLGREEAPLVPSSAEGDGAPAARRCVLGMEARGPLPGPAGAF